jgi:hypothetical protein
VVNGKASSSDGAYDSLEPGRRTTSIWSTATESKRENGSGRWTDYLGVISGKDRQIEQW